MLGDTVPWPEVRELHIAADGLSAGDAIRVITGQENQVILEAPSSGRCDLAYPITGPGFARVEIERSFLPGLPRLPALISNPIYFQPG